MVGVFATELVDFAMAIRTQYLLFFESELKTN